MTVSTLRTGYVRIPGRPPGANELIRMGHWKISTVRGRWKQATMEAIGEFPGPPMSHAEVAVLWRCRIRRKRDFDNLVSGLKPLLDGLVAAGVLEDDSTDCLTMLGPLRVEVGAEVDETILEITEVKG